MPKDTQTVTETDATERASGDAARRRASGPARARERARGHDAMAANAPPPAAADPFPMQRPALLARAACTGAAAYVRGRDLPGAVPGLLAQPGARILARLAEAEARCETARRERAPGYRPARHVQILAALIAETRATTGAGAGAGAAAGADADQPKASGSSPLRRAMNA